ncbi:hypothetical protein D3C72_994630 [compost metagenome]
MAVFDQVHLRHIHQVGVEAFGKESLAQRLAINHAAIGTSASKTWFGRCRVDAFQDMRTQRRFDAVRGDHQVADEVSAVGEKDASLVTVLLNANRAFVELSSAFRKMSGENVEKVRTVYGRLAHARHDRGCQVLGIAISAAPFEPYFLPRRWSTIVDFAVILTNAQAIEGAYCVCTEGDTSTHFTEGWSRLEKRDLDIAVAAKIKGKANAGYTATNDSDTQGMFRNVVVHLSTHG